jgi:hypothetical protein
VIENRVATAYKEIVGRRKARSMRTRILTITGATLIKP